MIDQRDEHFAQVGGVIDQHDEHLAQIGFGKLCNHGLYNI